MIITHQLIESGMSDMGGWSRNQLALIGVPWPPKRGWKSRIVGNDISDSSAARFVAMRKTKSTTTKNNPNSDLPIPTR